MKKKLFSSILSLSLVAVFSVSAFAADGEPLAVDADPGDPIWRSYALTEEVTDEVGSGFIDSPADVEGDLEKLASVEENPGSTTRASWAQLSPYTVYGQCLSNYCGPATVQAVLFYLNGSVPSQDTVATGCKTVSGGTSMANMVSYTNKQQSKNTYVVASIKSRDDMNTRLYSGISSLKAPPMLGLSFSSTDGWAYSTGGHAMSVYAAMSDKSTYMVADPWILYAGITSTKSSYSRTSSQLYKALVALAW